MAVKKTTKAPVVKGKATRPSFAEGNEGKHNRFQFYATLRVNKAIKLFKQLGNLKNKAIYSYTDSEILSMCKVLTNSLETMKTALTNASEKIDTSFRFDA